MAKTPQTQSDSKVYSSKIYPDRDFEYAIRLQGINKFFGAVHANKDIDLAVPTGAIHGIIGENGAGKSTLMSILYGFYQADSGTITINEQPISINSSKDAITAGIGMVHQHFMLVGNFTVLENIVLGAEVSNLLNISFAHARQHLDTIAKKYGLEVDLDAITEDLPVGQQQRVEILKTLYRGARILILDEPTAVLTPQETIQLFKILNALKQDGVTVILITHKLKEIMAVTENVSVMRRGEMVAHRTTADTNTQQLADDMVGRSVSLRVSKTDATPTDVKLSTKDVTYLDHQNVPRLKNITMELRAGEIVGIAGVSGNGQTELLEVLSGMRPINSGEMILNARVVNSENNIFSDEVRDLNIAHIPEDRLKMGLVKNFAAYENYILGYHNRDQYNTGLFMNGAAILNQTTEKLETFDVRPRDALLRSANFSGGNQQKLIVARELSADPDILLVGQPTRGVDIGAIEFIHSQLIAMRDRGKAVLLVSVELDEIIALSDRVLVMFDGEIVGQATGDNINEKTIGLMMANAHE